MREVIFIKSLCQDIMLFLYKTVNFKTTTESLGRNQRKIPLCPNLGPATGGTRPMKHEAQIQ